MSNVNPSEVVQVQTKTSRSINPWHVMAVLTALLNLAIMISSFVWAFDALTAPARPSAGPFDVESVIWFHAHIAIITSVMNLVVVTLNAFDKKRNLRTDTGSDYPRKQDLKTMEGKR